MADISVSQLSYSDLRELSDSKSQATVMCRVAPSPDLVPGRACPSALWRLQKPSKHTLALTHVSLMERALQVFLVVSLSYLKMEQQNNGRIVYSHNRTDLVINESCDQKLLFIPAFSFQRYSLNLDFS